MSQLELLILLGRKIPEIYDPFSIWSVHQKHRRVKILFGADVLSNTNDFLTDHFRCQPKLWMCREDKYEESEKDIDSAKRTKTK